MDEEDTMTSRKGFKLPHEILEGFRIEGGIDSEACEVILNWDELVDIRVLQ